MSRTPALHPISWRMSCALVAMAASLLGQTSVSDLLPANPAPGLSLAQLQTPGSTFHLPSTSASGRTGVFQRSRQRMALGRKLLEEGRFLEARLEFDAAVEILVGTAAIDFSSDLSAREELERLIQDIHRLEVTRMDLADLSATPVYQQSPLDHIPELTFPIDPSLKATVVDQIRSRSGDFPLEVNDTVLSYVRYFTSERGARTFVAGYRRSGRYRDMILRILDEEGLPRELIHLAQAESGFMPRAVSKAAAGGLWQFIRSRGREYDLLQSSYTDDRFDPEKATRAAAKHLRDLYHEFGDWNLAMAAYNCGPACVSRAVERTGYADFWELRRLNVIPKETTNYVPIVQALAIISLNPDAYGIELPEMDPPLLFDTHNIEVKTNLSLVADVLGITKAEVRDLNPAVKGDLAPAGYALRVPKQSVPVLISGLHQVPAANRVGWRAHRVNEGDTLPEIAKQYKTTSSKIVEANALSAGESKSAPASVQPGDLLLIPAAYSAPTVRRKTTRKTTSARHTRARKSTSKSASVAKKPKSTSRKSASVSKKPASTSTRKSPSRVATAKRTTAGSSSK